MTTLDRICLLVAYYPPAAESGARRPYNLVRELRAAGFSVDVLVAAPGETAPVTGDHGETIVHVVPHRPRSRSLWQRILRRVRIKWLRTFVSEFDPAVDVRRPLRRLLDATLSRRDAILYVSAPWGLQFEAISFPQGMAYEREGGPTLWSNTAPSE